MFLVEVGWRKEAVVRENPGQGELVCVLATFCAPPALIES